MVDTQMVTLQYLGKTAIITLNNPKKVTALNQDGYYLLATLLREIARKRFSLGRDVSFPCTSISFHSCLHFLT